MKPFHVVPDKLSLDDNEIHVWRVSMERAVSTIGLFSTMLSPDEKVRSNSFHFPKDRDRFVVRRGVLRLLTGRYLGTEPSRVTFTYSPFGKPSLESPLEAQSLAFNLSHSGGRALYAFSRGLPAGVDLERIRSSFAFTSIAKRFFSPAEVDVFCSLLEQHKTDAFFSCWTRKEAFIKAKGVGLSLGLDQFDVSLRPGEPARLLRTRYDERDVHNWTLHTIDAGARFKAALAVKALNPKISCYRV